MADATWTVGQVKMTKLVEFEAALPAGPGSMLLDASPDAVRDIGWLAPHFATEDGFVHLAVQALLVETPTARVVVDTCVGNGKERSNPLFNMLQTDFLDRVQAAGWDPATVDAVVCTHLHTDHVGWNTTLEEGRWVPAFPNARYIVVRDEYEHWLANEEHPDAPRLLADSVQPVLDAGLVDLVGSTTELAPGLRLEPAPGHTPAHAVVVIESGGEQAVLCGDAMHHPCQVARPEWGSTFDSDPELARRTRVELLDRLAGTGTLLVGAHFGGASGGRVERDGSGFVLVP